MKIQSRLAQKGPHLATLNVKHGETTRYRQSLGSSISIHEEAPQYTVVNGAFPRGIYGAELLIETVRDPENPSRMAFLHWKNGRAKILQEIGYAGKILVPPDPTSSSFPDLSLPDRLLPCGEPAELVADISSSISSFVKLLPDQMRIVTAFVMASWFPDCFEVSPYLWIVGPLGSGKTKLLKVLWCLCRRGLIVADVRGASIYKLMDAWNPTLLIDDLELGNSGPNNELLRMLRTGSVPGVPTLRNGVRFSTYGPKVVSSRQPIGDAALASRGLIISMLPTETETLPLDEAAMQELEKRFQPRLCMLRLTNYTAVRNHCASSKGVQTLSPRAKQIARVLTAPLLGAAEYSSMLFTILQEHDDEARIERSLEPEWLVAETLLAVFHEGSESGRLVSEILVGGVATLTNQRLQTQGEDIRLGAKKVGVVLKSLGVRTTRLGRLGRGLKLTPVLERKIHEISAQLGINRRDIAMPTGLEYGCGGAPCALCKKFGLTGGLRFVEIPKYQLRKHPPSGRIPLFDQKDGNEN